MAKKRMRKRPGRAPIVRAEPNVWRGVFKLVQGAAVALDVRGSRLPNPAEEKSRQHDENCREAATMKIGGAPYSAIAARQGCAISTAHERVNAWYRLVRKHEDFELMRTKTTARLEWIFEQAVKAYSEVAGAEPWELKAIGKSRVPLYSKTRLICELLDRMNATTELHARVQGLLVEQNTVNIGDAAGAQLNQLNLKLPDDPDKRDRLLEHCRAVEGIVQEVCEE